MYLSKSIESRLRSGALLLMSLPAIVASACFAHGHGALESTALLAILVASIAAGALGAYRLLSLAHRELAMLTTHSDFGLAAVLPTSTK